jgi:chromosome segregation ATPase
MHAKTCEEMHQLLTIQRATAEKWGNESKSIQSHYEARITDARDTISRLTSRTTDLETQIEKIDLQRREALTALATEKSSSTRMFSRLATAEQKSDACARQVQALLKREGELVGKTRSAERDLKRVNGERERLERERKVVKEVVGVRGFETSDVDALVADIQRVKQRGVRARSPTRRARHRTFEAATSDDDL